VSEQHLDTLSIVPGAFEGFGPGKRSCDVAGVLVDATWESCAATTLGSISLSAGPQSIVLAR
jgi:hypothetical protein